MNVVNNFIRLGEKYTTEKSTGPRKKRSHRDKGKILQEARRNKPNASQMKRKWDLPVVNTNKNKLKNNKETSSY